MTPELTALAIVIAGMVLVGGKWFANKRLRARLRHTRAMLDVVEYRATQLNNLRIDLKAILHDRPCGMALRVLRACAWAG